MADSKNYRVLFPDEYNANIPTAGYTNVFNSGSSHTTNITMNFTQTTTALSLQSLEIAYHFKFTAESGPSSMSDINPSYATGLCSVKITNTTEGTKTFYPDWTFEQLSVGDGRDIDTVPDAYLLTLTVPISCQIPVNTAFAITLTIGKFTYTYGENRTGTGIMQTRTVESTSLTLRATTDPYIRTVLTSMVLNNNSPVIWGRFSASYQTAWIMSTITGQRWQGPDVSGTNQGYETIAWPTLPLLTSNFPSENNGNLFLDWTRYSSECGYQPDIIDGGGAPQYSYYPINTGSWKISLNYDTYSYEYGHWEVNPQTGKKEWVVDGVTPVRKNMGYPWIYDYVKYVKNMAVFLYCLFDYLFIDSNQHSRFRDGGDLQAYPYYDSTLDSSESTKWVTPETSTSYTYSDGATGYTPSGRWPSPLPAKTWEYTGDSVIRNARPESIDIVNQNITEKHLFSSLS